MFAKPRRFRADFAWPDRKLIVEVEGGTFTRGRHVRPLGFEHDCTKYNLAALQGFYMGLSCRGRNDNTFVCFSCFIGGEFVLFQG